MPAGPCYLYLLYHTTRCKSTILEDKVVKANFDPIESPFGFLSCYIILIIKVWTVREKPPHPFGVHAKSVSWWTNYARGASRDMIGIGHRTTIYANIHLEARDGF